MLLVNKQSELRLLRMLHTFENCWSLSISHACWVWRFSKSLELRYCVERNDVLRHMWQLEKHNVKLEPWTSAMEEASRRICHPGTSRARWNPDSAWIRTVDVLVLVWNTLSVSYCMLCQSQPSLTSFMFVFVFTCYLIHSLSCCWAKS